MDNFRSSMDEKQSNIWLYNLLQEKEVISPEVKIVEQNFFSNQV